MLIRLAPAIAFTAIVILSSTAAAQSVSGVRGFGGGVAPLFSLVGPGNLYLDTQGTQGYVYNFGNNFESFNFRNPSTGQAWNGAMSCRGTPSTKSSRPSTSRRPACATGSSKRGRGCAATSTSSSMASRPIWGRRSPPARPSTSSRRCPAGSQSQPARCSRYASSNAPSTSNDSVRSATASPPIAQGVPSRLRPIVRGGSPTTARQPRSASRSSVVDAAASIFVA